MRFLYLCLIVGVFLFFNSYAFSQDIPDGNSLMNRINRNFTIERTGGSGIFQVASLIKVGISPWNLASGDFDRDVHMDLAVPNYNSGSVSILHNNGIGSFTVMDSLIVGGGPRIVGVADIDGDNYPDIIVPVSYLNTVQVWRNDGTGNFLNTFTVSTYREPAGITLNDFNGDAKVDFAICNVNNNRISLFLNIGDGTFTSEIIIGYAGYSPLSIKSGDFDRDGDIDLAVPNKYSGDVYIYLNDGNGQFSHTTTTLLPNWVNDITIGDWDSDGDLDIAASLDRDSRLSILKNNGYGIFEVSSNPIVGNNPYGLISGDWDGNGILDLAVAAIGSNWNETTISILLNDGQGNFVRTSNPETEGTAPAGIVGGDWDNDGDIDLAITNIVSNTVTILNNQNRYEYVVIDIKPGSYPNSINCLNQNGVIPVAILSTPEFDARTVDHTTVRFGPAGAKEVHCMGGNSGGKDQRRNSSDDCIQKRHEEDVDGDGDIDLVFHFKHSETGITCSDTIGILIGKTLDGQDITGNDLIRPVRSENQYEPLITNEVSPVTFVLSENYPNPFNPSTSIRYGIPSRSHVKLDIFNTLGQKVVTLVDAEQDASYYNVEWGTNISSGMYFYRLEAVDVSNPVNRFVETKKMLLLR